MPRAARSAPERAIPAIAREAITGASPRGRLCVALILSATLAAIGPDRLARGPHLCLISAVIRRPCPACGMTRAASALLRGDPRRAMRTNPRIIPVAAIGGAMLLSDLISVTKRARECRPDPALPKQGGCDARSASPRQPGNRERISSR